MEQSPRAYAGFWMRFIASVIDGVLLGIVNIIILVPFLSLVGITAAARASDVDMENEGAGLMIALLSTYFISMLAVVIAGWLYFALMESSARGATLGKMALGLRVTTLGGDRIGFGRATGRYFGKILSSIFFIGYIMAAFTARKQALHDMMAGCLVIRN
ncbi:MAG TPA: RDD family protein [Bacteroidota bacterium]|nr:RDD family protein [Bacteroidota bacterium]